MVGQTFLFPVVRSPRSVLSTFVSQLFSPGVLYICVGQDFAKALGKEDDRPATNSPWYNNCQCRFFKYEIVCHVHLLPMALTASNWNEYQWYLLGWAGGCVEGAPCVGLTTLTSFMCRLSENCGSLLSSRPVMGQLYLSHLWPTV